MSTNEFDKLMNEYTEINKFDRMDIVGMVLFNKDKDGLYQLYLYRIK